MLLVHDPVHHIYGWDQAWAGQDAHHTRALSVIHGEELPQLECVVAAVAQLAQYALPHVRQRLSIPLPVQEQLGIQCAKCGQKYMESAHLPSHTHNKPY